MTIWFTADTHFGHAKIIQYCNRPFENVDEMDGEIIRHWNFLVGEQDDVFHLGDFCFGNPTKYLSQLRGKIHFVPGSHDDNMRKKLDNIIFLPELSKISPPSLVDEFGNRRIIVLCHYAMRSWALSHYASWHLYGHHHGRIEPHGLSFDVGVDCWSFAPVSLDEVADKMATMRPILDYRKAAK
jgi:calcineurin-like phosphoesterase family protein